jgi:hypothetical protein
MSNLSQVEIERICLSAVASALFGDPKDPTRNQPIKEPSEEDASDQGGDGDEGDEGYGDAEAED